MLRSIATLIVVCLTSLTAIAGPLDGFWKPVSGRFADREMTEAETRQLGYTFTDDKMIVNASDGDKLNWPIRYPESDLAIAETPKIALHIRFRRVKDTLKVLIRVDESPEHIGDGQPNDIEMTLQRVVPKQLSKKERKALAARKRLWDDIAEDVDRRLNEQNAVEEAVDQDAEEAVEVDNFEEETTPEPTGIPTGFKVQRQHARGFQAIMPEELQQLSPQAGLTIDQSVDMSEKMLYQVLVSRLPEDLPTEQHGELFESFVRGFTESLTDAEVLTVTNFDDGELAGREYTIRSTTDGIPQVAVYRLTVANHQLVGLGVFQIDRRDRVESVNMDIFFNSFALVERPMF